MLLKDNRVFRILLFLVLILSTFLSTGLLSAQDDDVELTVWTFLDISTDDPRARAFREIIALFEEQNPNIQINVESQPWRELGPKFMAAAQSGNAPDVSWIRLFDVWSMIQLDVLADLTSYMPDGYMDGFPIQALNEIGQFEGGDYSQSLWPSGYMLYYRIDLFEEAGINPEDIRTWDDFVQVAQQLTDEDERVWGFGRSMLSTNGRSPIYLGMVPLGVEPLDPETGQVDLTNEAATRTVELFTDFITEYGVTPVDAVNMGGSDLNDQFASGRYAMMGQVINSLPGLRESAVFGGENIGITTWPTWDGEGIGPTWTTSWELGMWADTPHPEEAWKFLEFLVSEEADALWATEAGMMPVRASTLDDPLFLEPEKEYVETVFNAMAENSWSLPWNHEIGRYEEMILQAEQQIIINDAAVEEALEEAEEEFNLEL